MNWLFYFLFGSFGIGAVLAVTIGLFAVLKEIIQDNPSRKMGVAKAASFFFGISILSFGWLVLITILPFWGVWVTIAIILATLMIGALLLEFAGS